MEGEKEKIILLCNTCMMHEAHTICERMHTYRRVYACMQACACTENVPVDTTVSEAHLWAAELEGGGGVGFPPCKDLNVAASP